MSETASQIPNVVAAGGRILRPPCPAACKLSGIYMTSRAAVSVDHAAEFARIIPADDPNYPAAIVLMPAGHDTNFDTPPSGATIYVFRLTAATTLLFSPAIRRGRQRGFQNRF